MKYDTTRTMRKNSRQHTCMTETWAESLALGWTDVSKKRTMLCGSLWKHKPTDQDVNLPVNVQGNQGGRRALRSKALYIPRAKREARDLRGRLTWIDADRSSIQTGAFIVVAEAHRCGFAPAIAQVKAGLKKANIAYTSGRGLLS